MRRAASSLCGRCSESIKRQLIVGNASSARFASVPTYHHHVRTLHHTAPYSTKRSNATAEIPKATRDFTSSSKSDAAAAVAPASTAASPEARLRLTEDNLLHPFSSSPVPEFRRRAAFTKQHAYCPHPSHQHTKVPTIAPKPEDASPTGGQEAPAHVDFECPDCGIAVYCSKEHWMDDYENHLKICDTLKQINEDDHDLRSGRVFPEANLPEHQLEESMVNMTNWDTFMYTRDFDAINSDRAQRQITRLLTYPVTIGSILHELSPYSLKSGERMTVEGLKSFSGSFTSIPERDFTLLRTNQKLTL